MGWLGASGMALELRWGTPLQPLRAHVWVTHAAATSTAGISRTGTSSWQRPDRVSNGQPRPGTNDKAVREHRITVIERTVKAIPGDPAQRYGPVGRLRDMTSPKAFGGRWLFLALALGVVIGAAVGAFVQLGLGTEQICTLTEPPRCGPTKHFQGDLTGVGLLLGGTVGFAIAAGTAARRRH